MTNIKTNYLPAEKSNVNKMREQISVINKFIQNRDIIDSIPSIFIILNYHRQIVYTNKTLLNNLSIESLDKVFGLRPGELLSCVHAFESEGGCGTTEFCRNCGAAKAIESSIQGTKDIQECRINTKDGEALDLKVWTTPLKVNDENYTIFALQDISNENRRKMLERIFFHDVLNTAGALRGWVQMLDTSEKDEFDFAKNTVYSISNEVIEQIMYQKVLLSAESNELQLNIEKVQIAALLKSVCEQYKKHTVSIDKKIKVDKIQDELFINTDSVILRRIVGNIVKNALEASRENQTVTISCLREEEKIIITVHNETFIPRNIQLQIFQRSFSTKGVDRGLGTYSIKMLTEKYLGGNVSFTSDEESGTTFYLSFKETVN